MSSLKEYLLLLYQPNCDVRRVSVTMSKVIKAQINEVIKNLPLHEDAPLIEKVYWIINDLLTYPIECACKICNNPITKGKFSSLKNGYSYPKQYCSHKCRISDSKYWDKVKDTNIARYGHSNNMHGKGVRERTTQKWIEQTGYDNPLKDPKIKEKVRLTNQLRRGVDMPSQDPDVRKKCEITCLKKYGYKNPFNGPKSKQTSMERYGVEYPMQCPEIYGRVNMFRRKTKTFPISGKQYIFQGYEDVAIELLMSLGITEDDIMVGDATKIPVVEYFNPVKNKLCHYYPDIFIKSQNKVIEVKSTYTLKAALDVTMAKQASCISLGLQHEIWVCSSSSLLYIIDAN